MNMADEEIKNSILGLKTEVAALRDAVGKLLIVDERVNSAFRLYEELRKAQDDLWKNHNVLSSRTVEIEKLLAAQQPLNDAIRKLILIVAGSAITGVVGLLISVFIFAAKSGALG